MESKGTPIWSLLEEFLFGSGGLLLVLLTISAVYFFTNREPSIIARLFASAHGVITAILYAAALALWNAGWSSQTLLFPFWFLLLLPFVSIIYSFWGFKGHKAIHVLQLPNVLCLAGVWLVGSMAVTNDWL